MHLTSQLFISVQVKIKCLRIQFFYSLEVTIVVASVADFDLLILVSHYTGAFKSFTTLQAVRRIDARNAS